MPLDYEGVKLMSYGWVPQTRVIDGQGNVGDDVASASAVMRGPMVAQLVNELATRTAWGDLDVLVIDMPPGTGDVAITLTQNIKITGAVIVTTPQKLAYVDVVRGIDLFDQTNVPVLAVVENMAYFIAPSDPSQTKHFLFGDGAKYVDKLRTQWGIDKFFSVPIVPDVAAHGDGGDPFVLGPRIDSQQPDTNYLPLVHMALDQYKSLASYVSKTLADSRLNSRARTAKYNSEANIVEMYSVAHNTQGSSAIPLTSSQKEQLTLMHSIPARELRLACKCAACVHEYTGVPLIRPDRIPANVHPKTLTARGQYAVAVTWSDGHQSSLYPWKYIEELVSKSSTSKI